MPEDIMKIDGSYVLFMIIWVVVVVVGAMVVHIAVDGFDRRYRQRGRLTRADPSAPMRSAWLGVPPRVWIVIVGMLVSVGTLFAIAEHTVMAREDSTPWLGSLRPTDAIPIV